MSEPETLGPVCRIVLLVRDYDASLHFYRDLVGLPLAGTAHPGWAVFRTGDASLCLRGPWPGMPWGPDTFGSSPDEICLRSADLDRTREILCHRGIDVSEPHTPGPGIRIAEFRDPDGRRVALEEHHDPIPPPKTGIS